MENGMRMTWWTLLLLSIGLVAVSGCPTAGDDDDSSAGDDDDATDPPCAGILGTSPEPDDTGVFTSKVSVTWDAVPENGTLTVADDAGAAVTGTTTEEDNGRTLVFDAGDALAASTTFNVTIAQDCADDVPFSFTTGPYGDTVTTEDDLIDRRLVGIAHDQRAVQPQIDLLLGVEVGVVPEGPGDGEGEGERRGRTGGDGIHHPGHSVHLPGDVHAMPVDGRRRVQLVRQIHDQRIAHVRDQRGSRHLPVVGVALGVVRRSDERHVQHVVRRIQVLGGGGAGQS